MRPRLGRFKEQCANLKQMEWLTCAGVHASPLAMLLRYLAATATSCEADHMGGMSEHWPPAAAAALEALQSAAFEALPVPLEPYAVSVRMGVHIQY